MADETACGAALALADEVLRCDLPSDHTESGPGPDRPQGTPHQDSDSQDVLTGEPWTWWG